MEISRDFYLDKLIKRKHNGLHATFWRDKTPFKESREKFYENNKEGKLKNPLDNFYYKEDIDSIVKEIEKLLNCG